MYRNDFLITYTLHNQENVIKFDKLSDCSTTSYLLIDEDYAHRHHLLLHLVMLLSNLTVIHEQPITSGAITHIICTCLAISHH
jgi:hypothetical protein